MVRGRDFTPDGEIGAVEIRDGDRCARCGSALKLARGIELGHVFQLGRKYAEAFGLTALGPEGKPVTVTMGSYGVGITRAVAALAEQTYDEVGLCWPRSVAPADVQVVPTGKDEIAYAEAERLASELAAAGVRVLLDDRKASPGVKFKDAELLGVPTDPDRRTQPGRRRGGVAGAPIRRQARGPGRRRRQRGAGRAGLTSWARLPLVADLANERKPSRAFRLTKELGSNGRRTRCVRPGQSSCLRR